MRKIALSFLLFITLFIVGCGRSTKTVETHTELEYDWQATINELQGMIETKTNEIANLKRVVSESQHVINDFETQLEASMQFPLQLPFNWTPERVRQNLVACINAKHWGGIFETDLFFYFCEDSIFRVQNYATAVTFSEPFFPTNHQSLTTPHLLLTYTIIDEEKIEWRPVGHHFVWGYGFHPIPIHHSLRYRHVSNAESVTIRFYNIPCIDDRYLQAFYIEMVIPGADLWQDTIETMERLWGIRIWDWWYEDRRIYVDLSPSQWLWFTGGSQSFSVSARAILLTFASFPDVDEIEILFGGNQVAIDHHGSIFGHYVIGEGFPLSPYSYSIPIAIPDSGRPWSEWEARLREME